MCTTVLGTKILANHMSRKTPAYNYCIEDNTAKFVANQIPSTNKQSEQIR